MKLDPKYFPPFLIVMALVAALLITYFTVTSQQGQRESFREYAFQQDSLQTAYMPVWEGEDSLGVESFPNRYVILDFWATWSNFSEEIHSELQALADEYPNRVVIVAAVVKDRPADVNDYINRHDYPFRFVNGTLVFNRFRIPGLPTQFVFNPSGKLLNVHFGMPEENRYDSLRTLLSDEQ